jgi:hypothetical protein
VITASIKNETNNDFTTGEYYLYSGNSLSYIVMVLDNNILGKPGKDIFNGVIVWSSSKNTMNSGVVGRFPKEEFSRFVGTITSTID